MVTQDEILQMQHAHYENTVAAILTLATLQGQNPSEDAAIAAWARMVQKVRSMGDSINPVPR